ncbi:hypothetical protein [Piscinibacter sp. XHJ-5]|uniref:hypothetical protein n=1 Tax=Piscinibacter sp. XHJ-5 TaxID=3037797 RepID=UPI002452D96D|nr:hypothetical protein [Piscinibacter sp. XHJ-5]
MDVRKLIDSGSEQELEAAIRTLAATVREAGECMLDLQGAVEMLKLAHEPAFARAVQRDTLACIRKAMLSR